MPYLPNKPLQPHLSLCHRGDFGEAPGQLKDGGWSPGELTMGLKGQNFQSQPWPPGRGEGLKGESTTNGQSWLHDEASTKPKRMGFPGASGSVSHSSKFVKTQEGVVGSSIYKSWT